MQECYNHRAGNSSPEREKMDDIAQLIKGCLCDDNNSWNLLLSSCTSITSSLHRHRYTSLSPEDTENIISNVYTKLFDGGLRSFSGTTKYELLSFIKTITRNETISYLRANLKRQKDTSIDQEFESDNDFSLHDLLEDNTLRPDTIAEINDLYRKAMGKLSIRDKQILLYKIEGYMDREISELLGIPMGTVAVSYNRIKELLREALILSILIILLERNLTMAASL